MWYWNILLIFILIAINAFFVSVEFAAIASRRSRIEILADQGNGAARIVKNWLEHPANRDRLIAGSQLGITIVSLALGAVGENTFQEMLAPLFARLVLPTTAHQLAALLAWLPLALSLVIITSLHVVLGEQVPKVATLHDPEGFALVAARPMQFFISVFRWFIGALDWSTRHVLVIFGLKMVGEHLTVYTVEEIKQILSDSEEVGVIEEPEREMLESVFDLGDLLVRQVMVPRTEIHAVEAGTPLPELIDLVTQTTFTKFPVYEGDLDHITGVLYVKDLMRLMNTQDPGDETARSLDRPAIYVPETISVHDLLHQFRSNRQHIAIVLDEYGGTAGMVTLEDLLEEIVGEVNDPFDEITPDIQQLPDGSAVIDGLTLIEDVNQQLDLDLQDPYHDTIAGYVLGVLKHIPRLGETIEKEGVSLRVEAMDGMRIARISLTRKPSLDVRQPPASAEPGKP